jgi:DUF2950 family protein
MKPMTVNSKCAQLRWAPCIAGLACLLIFQGRAASPAAAKSASPAAGQPRIFATPHDAVEAMIKAARTFNVPALQAIYGPAGQDLIVTGERVRDRERATTFAALADEKRRLVADLKNRRRLILTVGKQDWPFPVPLVRNGGRWHFDARAGRREILYRRIGENELDAIELCRGYVEAQHEYALQKRDNSHVNQYAQRIVSTPGKQDGLAWRNADGSWGGPVGERIARVIQSGYSSRTEPYHGYHFKVLKGQGPAAPLGQMDFVVKGVMIGGFALVASPAQYGATGVKSFIVSHDGIVYEKDLGPNTLELFKKMQRYNPDKTWHPVSEHS